MTSASFTSLATWLNEKTDAGEVSVTGTNNVIHVDGCDVKLTRELRGLLEAAGWSYEIEDPTQGPVDIAFTARSYETCRITARNPDPSVRVIEPVYSAETIYKYAAIISATMAGVLTIASLLAAFVF